METDTPEEIRRARLGQNLIAGGKKMVLQQVVFLELGVDAGEEHIESSSIWRA